MRNRKSIRLKDYDYSKEGAYFVTLGVWQKECLLGEVVEGEMVLNEVGEIVKNSWMYLEQRHEYIELDEWVIMPNHFHGIIWIHDLCRGGSRTAPTGKRKTLGRLVGMFKTISTKEINLMHQTPRLPFWQRNYYEHVIRNDDDLFKIREYIQNNPLKWELDPENPSVENRMIAQQ